MSSAKRFKAYEAIADQLLQEITAKIYPVGTRLPAERELSERFSVSRTTVREAIRYLESIGCVETRAGAGTFVKRQDIRQIATSISATFLQGSALNCDLLEVRMLLDTEIATLVASRRTAEQLQALKQNVEDMQNDIEAGGSGAQYFDEAFHLLLAKATNNAVLSSLAEMCAGIYSYTVNLSHEVSGMPHSGLSQHQEIVTAIENRDVKKTRMLMKQHILKTIYYG